LLKLNLKKGVLRMLNRFGLIIHWLGFIFSVFFAVFIIAALVITRADTLDSEAIGAFVQMLYYTFGSLPGGWVIRFILTGHKGLMPWSKAKQPASPEN